MITGEQLVEIGEKLAVGILGGITWRVVRLITNTWNRLAKLEAWMKRHKEYHLHQQAVEKDEPNDLN